jgi:hypothetical protein
MTKTGVIADDAFIFGSDGQVGLSAKDKAGNIAAFVLDHALTQTLIVRLLRHLVETGREAPDHQPDQEVEMTECSQIGVAIAQAGEGVLLLDFGPARLPVRLDVSTLRTIGAAMLRTAEALEAPAGRA